MRLQVNRGHTNRIEYRKPESPEKQEEQRKSGELDEYYENIEKLFNN